MAYVGTPLDTTNAFQSLAGKRFNGDASTTDFTLDSSPNSTLDIEVFVENVRQDPNAAYTVSGTTLAFTAAPPSGTNNIYVVHQAKAVGTIDPAVGSTLDLNGAAELVLDADADTAISADAADDQIDIKIGGNDDFKLTAKTLTIGGAAAADTAIVFDGNAQDYYIALDDSADDLLIGLGSTVGTTPAISIDENLVTTFSGDVSLSNDTAGNILTLEHTGGSNTGNTYIEWKTGGASSAILGKTSGSDERLELWNKSNDYLSFGTNNSERIRIIAGGQVGVGTTSPGSARMNVQQNANELYYGKNDSSGQFSVTSAGVISATNTTVQSISDERLKKDIADFSGGLNIVKAMKPKTYKWKNPQYHNDKDDTQYGFVAQELLTISNAEKMNMVIVDDANTMMYENEKDLLTDGKAHISGYQEKDAIYVSAVKELSAKVDTLETENTALKARVKTLEDA